ncbi:hypothetical protein QUF50_00850 [Thiotrichales bacterium HSG1]|nr:hypothetical protein [Thiotrichales bacterium HSG1]
MLDLIVLKHKKNKNISKYISNLDANTVKIENLELLLPEGRLLKKDGKEHRWAINQQHNSYQQQ